LRSNFINGQDCSL